MKEAEKINEDALDMELRLWDYIDGRSTDVEQSAITQLLRDRSDWAVKYHELLATNSELQSLETDQPSLRFTKNVMEEIARYSIAPATRSYINKNIIRGIGLFFVTSILALVAYLLPGAFAGGATEAGNNSAERLMEYTALFNSSYVSVFVMLNILLSLLLLDRYLRRKMQGPGSEAS